MMGRTPLNHLDDVKPAPELCDLILDAIKKAEAILEKEVATEESLLEKRL